METLKLAVFVIDQLSRSAIDRAGADWIGGDTRRARADAREHLREQALDALFPRWRS